MSKVTRLIIILGLACTTGLYAQESENLFSYADEQRSSLSVTAGELLTTIESKSQIKSVRLVKAENLASKATSEVITVEMPNGIIYSFQRNTNKFIKSDYQYWNGFDAENNTSLSMVIKGNEITGMIRGKDITLDVNPLRNTSFHTLQEIDPSKLEKELAPLPVQDNENESKQKEVMQKSTTPTINVLVAYTTDAKNNHSGNIESSIVLAEGNLDNSFSNSDINADIDVVHTMVVSYSATSTSLQNLCRLTTSPTFTAGLNCSQYSSSSLQGYMGEIHEKRYEHDAQVVVLVTDAGGPGIAWLNSDTKYAFSIAREDRFVSTYTMAHEIGHNIGAQHNKDEDTNPNYSYGHGYNYNPSDWSTIMAYPPTGSSRINHFSNPNETFAGVATGTVADEDNARVWDNRASTVSNFDPPASPPKVLVSGSAEIETNESHTYTATVTGGVTPFSYQWSARTSATDPWTNLGTGSSISYSSSATGAVSLRVIATDNESNTDDDILTIVVTDGSGCIFCKQVTSPTNFAIENNYPNPFNPSTQVNFELPETADVSIKVYNIVGQEVATLVNEQMQAGFHNATFEADNLASGVYIARLTASGSSGEQFVSEIKMQLIK